MNAQKKRLDVWLIYRCVSCGSVWNCAVVSRGRPGGVGRELLERFMGNDPGLALECALDAGELPGDEDCRVEIHAEGLSGIRLAAVLRAKLGLSRSELEQLVGAGDVACADGADALAAKLRPHRAVMVRARRC